MRELDEAGHRKACRSSRRDPRPRSRRVAPEYLREMQQLGYTLPIDELVRARDHGVSAEYVREHGGARLQRLPIDALIRLRDHGVTPEYARS